MIRDNIEPIPIKLWNWGIIHRGRIREKSPEVLKRVLLPRCNLSISTKGIRLPNTKLFYTNEKAEKEQQFLHAEIYGSREAEGHVDSRNLKNIFVLNSNKNTEFCHLMKKSATYEDAFLEEVMDFNEINDIKAKSHQTSYLQACIERDANNKAIIDEEKALTKATIPKWMSNRKRSENMRAYRTEEHERLRKELFIKEAATETDQGNILRLVKPTDITSEIASPHMLFPNRQKKILDIMRRNRADKE